MKREIKIVPVMDHYEIYVNGNFYCSTDTYSEAVKEINNLEE